MARYIDADVLREYWLERWTSRLKNKKEQG